MADNDNLEVPGQDTNGGDRASNNSSEWQDINNTPPTSIDFVTLGMFIIDEIEYPPPRPPSTNVLGGAGSYSALGARLFSSAPDLSRSVGWIVDQGSDFPQAITDLINGWSTSAVFRHDPSRLTTRGWNGYVDSSERREFKYTTPKKRLTAADLSGTPLLKAKAVHMVCSPNRCKELVEEIITLRKREAKLAAASRSQPTNDGDEDDDEDENDPNTYTRPLIIWEPVPDLCTPFELLNCTNALPLIDICSPNHAELAGFMGTDGLDPETGQISEEQVERNCEQLLASMPLTTYTLMVRAGEKGCYVARNGRRRRKRQPPATGKDGNGEKKKKKKVGLDARNFHGGLQPDTDMEALFAGLLQDMEDRDNEDDPFGRFDGDDGEGIEVDPGIERWLPAYHTDASKVVDPTGGGNTFLGGLAVALARGKSIEEACTWGSVAASFAIEQVGVPEIGTDEEGRETWNGERVEERLRGYVERVGLMI